MDQGTENPQKALYEKHKPLCAPENEGPLLPRLADRVLIPDKDQHEDPRHGADNNAYPQDSHCPVDEVFAADPPCDQFVEVEEKVEDPGCEVPSRQPGVP